MLKLAPFHSMAQRLLIQTLGNYKF